MTQTEEPAAAPRGQQPADAAPDQPAAPEVALPERPALAPGVHPKGQMQESAFVDPPWMIEREESGYIQVTELLHRLAEQCNGEQTIDEIAAKLSETTGRSVSADNVRQLLEKQLVPKGIVAAEGGSETSVAATTSRSPLAVNMKMKMISPKVLDPLTNVLKLLFWPPILVAVLVTAGLAQAWMYFVHGVGGSIHEALYAPGLVLLVILIIVLSAGFHELGHAAALTYAGGKVKGVGAGIYLVYPAFYTDVTDNYRLGRWARVRTDLGGFYFNLIFALGIMAIYLLTGQEFLLMIVVLINIEIIHQLLPFVRLDGYWTLADVTGIPDFFSQMGAFIRSNLPFLKWEGRKLPALKWWAKAVFALYMIITIPLLLFVLFTMLTGIPRILGTAWDSFLQQRDGFVAAQGSGDGLGMAGAAAQMILLALPMLGLVYTLGKRAVTMVWNWSKPTPNRRLIGGRGTLAALGAAIFFWSPQLPFGQGAPGPLYARTSFRPIGPDERGSFFDVVPLAPPPIVRNAPGYVEPGPTPTARPPGGATAGPTAAPDAQPTVEATAAATPGGTPGGTPEGTPGRTAGPTPGATAGATVQPTAAAPAKPTAAAPPPAPPAAPPKPTVAPLPPAPAPAVTAVPKVVPKPSPAP